MRLSALCVTISLFAAAAPAQFEWNVWGRFEQGPGNIAVSPSGRVFVSMHQFFGTEARVAEVKPDGTMTPFPNAALSTFSAGEPLSLDSVLGLRCDSAGNLWLLDNGMREKSTPKLIAFNTETGRLTQVIWLPSTVTRPDSFLNDLVVDESTRHVYIADPAGGANAALIVVDLSTGASRRVLEGHRSVVPEAGVELQIEGKFVEIKRPDGTTFRPSVGVNPIGADVANEWLYFGPMHGTMLYRTPTAALRDLTLSPAQLAEKVEEYAKRPISDGITIDKEGNIYISEVGRNAVGVIRGGTRQYETVAMNAAISWPDAFSYGPDGRLYVVANQLHRSAVLNAGVNETKPPFLIFTFKPFAPGVVGR